MEDWSEPRWWSRQVSVSLHFWWTPRRERWTNVASQTVILASQAPPKGCPVTGAPGEDWCKRQIVTPVGRGDSSPVTMVGQGAVFTPDRESTR